MVPTNQARISLFCGGGKRGSGKSWGGLAVATTVFPEFSPVKHMAYFDGWSYLDLMDRCSPGDVTILDDFGVGMDSREWGKTKNILLTQIFETCRTDNVWAIVTVPDPSWIDKRMRLLADDYVVFQGVNYKNNTSSAKWFQERGDWFDPGKIWHNPLKVMVNGRAVVISSVKFPKPPKRITDEYEELRAGALVKLKEKARLVRDGASRSVTVEQAAKLLRLTTPQDLYDMIRDNRLEVDASSRGLKIHLSTVRKLWNSGQLVPNYEELEPLD
jgi:hypothetical protein